MNLRWDFNFRLLWDPEPDAVECHVYRDGLTNLSFQGYRVCRDDLDGTRTDTRLDDLEDPAPGDGFFYVITAEEALGDEGTLGLGTNAERSNFSPCP